MLIFPGFLFLVVFALAAEYIDRKLHAKLQNRVGPPWFQPLADLIKLAAKEDLIPSNVDPLLFRITPLVALAATVTAFFYLPLWSTTAPFHFTGDLIVVLYLLTIPTVTFFLAGWYSRSVFSMLGAARCIMQLFAYEIPLFLSILAPALLANTWSLSGMAAFYALHPAYAALNVIGLLVAMVSLLGKLEKVPFDIPEAETEIVAGSFTEYSGRLLAIFRLAIGIEMVVGASLIAAVFLPFGLNYGPVAGFALYLAKILAIVCVLALSRTLFARLRIDQMINFCWQVAAPVAFAQLLIDLLVKGVLKS
ncbi:MAG: complex I subunit 1 family protein [Phycisphaerae bacterium]|jgi:NADH-quinone oxidoreductase subunit H